MDKITSYVHYHEYDINNERPLLVLQLEVGSVGYTIDPDSGDLTRTCICAATCSGECVCGVED